MEKLWFGTLARGGRKPVEFQAEIIEDEDGKPVLIERRGIEFKIVSPHEVCADYWLKALIEVVKDAI